MCSGSEAGWYSRPIDVVYHSIVGLRVMKQKEEDDYEGVLELRGQALEADDEEGVQEDQDEVDQEVEHDREHSSFCGGALCVRRA